MNATGPTPPPDQPEGDSAAASSPQTPFRCAMPDAKPPQPRCHTQCAHCRYDERRQARVLPSDDGWVLVTPSGEVLSTHPDRELATFAFERYLLSDGPQN